MRLTFSFTPFLLVCSLLAVTQLEAQDSTNGTPRDRLQQLIVQLRKAPDDGALRGKIIALALTLNPKPATPDAVTMAEGGAEYAFKNAKANSDFSDAAKQYEKALLLAPWLAADYFNCGVAHEKAGENKEAVRSFKFYLLAAPEADDAQAVKKRIGGLQYAEQKQTSDATAKVDADAAAAKAQAEAAAKEQAELRTGKSYGGGTIFYIDRSGQHGLIAATTDLAKETGSRIPNDVGPWNRAIQSCKDYRGGGYTDWFMPSKDQLNMMYFQKNVLKGFGNDCYWSFTEDDPSTHTADGIVHNVFIQCDDGSGSFKGKSSTDMNLRAIRTF